MTDFLLLPPISTATSSNRDRGLEGGKRDLVKGPLDKETGERGREGRKRQKERESDRQKDREIEEELQRRRVRERKGEREREEK